MQLRMNAWAQVERYPKPMITFGLDLIRNGERPPGATEFDGSPMRDRRSQATIPVMFRRPTEQFLVTIYQGFDNTRVSMADPHRRPARYRLIAAINLDGIMPEGRAKVVA